MALSLNVEIRDRKTNPRRVRAKGTVPAICYGAGEKELLLAVQPKEFAAVLKQGGHLISLKLPTGEERKVVLRQVQRHPIKRDIPVHIDFLSVHLDRPMRIEVPLQLLGTAAGIKNGGVVQQSRRTILVECLPNDIPERLTHDISSMDLGSSVHVADLQMPPKVKAFYNENYTVASCQVTDTKGVPVAAAAADAAATPAAGAKAAPAAKAAAPAAGAKAAAPAAKPAAKK
jgi:large subunit ribosomal protein L25